MTLQLIKNIRLGDLTVDLNMGAIMKEYPAACLPTDLQPRTGQAKNSLFEEIDNSLYDKGAKIITYHTTADRILPWIKTFAIFYFDDISHISGARVEWKDAPTSAWDSSTEKPTITIELHDQAESESLIYNLTLFLLGCKVIITASL